MTRGSSALALWINLAVVYVVWGSTYFAIAIAIETLPPFLMAAARFALAGLILLAFDLLRHPAARRRPTRRQLVDSAIIGGLLLGIGNGFVVFSEQSVPSGIAAIMIGMMPVWFALLGWLYLRERLPRVVVFAVLLGFAGVALLVWPTGDGANHFDPLGIFVLVLAPIGWAHGSIYAARRAKLPSSPLTASGLQMLAGAVVTGSEGLLTGELNRLDVGAVSFASGASLLYLVLFGSMLAYTSYAWLLRNAPLSLVGTYAYVNPVVAVGLGTIFLGEDLSTRTIVAAAVVIVAVAIIVTARGRLAAARPAEVDAPPVDLEAIAAAAAGEDGKGDARAAGGREPGAVPVSAAAPPRAPSG